MRSLRSRRFEVVGERENGRARGRHAGGEGAPARKASENRFNSHLACSAGVFWAGESCLVMFVLFDVMTEED